MQISIATANTFHGQLLRRSNGLDVFQSSGVDVLLLQEVFGLDLATVESHLQVYGYGLVGVHLEAGLAIALRDRSEVSGVPGTARYESLTLRGGRFAHRSRPRGLLSVKLVDDGDRKFTVSTTHLSVFARHRARGLQLKALAHVLEQSAYTDRPLILGADMNHYPRAGKKDLGLHEAAGLSLAAITEPTWAIRGSKHEWLGRVGAAASRRPLDSFDAHLDAMLYRGSGLQLVGTEVLPVESDHRAIVGHFDLL